MAKRNKGINIFKHVPVANPRRTRFNMSHSCEFSGDFGLGYPVFCQEVIPGDTWHMAADNFSRLAPMIAPVYSDFDVKMHWFFVPSRLLWDDFEDWMTGGEDGTWREDNPDAFPVFRVQDLHPHTGEWIGGLMDFLGVNTCADGQENARIIPRYDETLPVMPLRGYFLVYNYFFRDQNVQEKLPLVTTSGIDESLATFWDSSVTKGGLFRVAWDKDYFTSATLSPQRGPQVFVPIGSSAPLVTTGKVAIVNNTELGPNSRVIVQGGMPSGTHNLQVSEAGSPLSGDIGLLKMSNSGVTSNAMISGSNYSVDSQSLVQKVSVDLSSSEGAAVDDVREAFALQRFFERMQIVGSRFAEFLRGIWGTNAGDARLQMPEYLGTWTNPFMVNNVSNTTGTTENPQAGYSGNGMLSQFNKPIHKNFPEYGYLYCIYSALPRNGYQQGLAPIFCRRDWLDFADPYFENIGEQPISIQELYYDPSKTRAENEETFGYQSQYASYKFINSHAHGNFKTDLNFWHTKRIFSSKPTLSDEFIAFNPEESTNRVFVLENEDKFFTSIKFVGYVERNLSAFSTPHLI